MAPSRKEIKALLPADLLDTIEKKAADLGMRRSTYLRQLCLRALNRETVIRAFGHFFKRGYIFESRVAIFGQERDLEPLLPDGDGVKRVSVYFLQNEDEYERIAYLSYCLGVDDAHAVTALITESTLQGVEVDGGGGTGRDHTDRVRVVIN